MHILFDWNRLGDIAAGRANLGDQMPVAVYRLLQYTMHDELTQRYGRDEADSIFRDAGFRAGTSFAHNMLDKGLAFGAFIAQLQQRLKEFQIGILRIEKSDLDNLSFTMTVSEDLDCSGLPVTDETVCVYDEGFIAGILEYYTGTPFDVREIDCWATGDRTCRFTAESKQTKE